MKSANVPPEGLDYWEDQDLDWPTREWVFEVTEGGTRAGYWEWATNKRNATKLLRVAENLLAVLQNIDFSPLPGVYDSIPFGELEKAIRDAKL